MSETKTIQHPPGRRFRGGRQAWADGRSAARGFTLIEVLIAFTLLALMTAAVFASFRLALNSYQKSQDRIEERARQRVMEDLIKRQVGSLFPLVPTYDFSATQLVASAMQAGSGSDLAATTSPLFLGNPDSMTFITVAPLQLLENPGLTVVRYGLAEDEWSRPYLGAMELRFDGLDSFQIMAGLPPGKPLVMIDGVDSVRFEYYGYEPELQTYQWFDEWRGDERRSVPSAVRVTAGDRALLVPINASIFGASTLRSRIRNLIQ